MYDVNILDFSGPMDLLLHLIKESKMDIMDIKLEIIINDYLDYIEKSREQNLDIASSYLVMASELLEIKSKKLLPSNKDEVIEEEIDLISRIQMYELYKEQIDNFKSLENLRSEYYTKVPSSLNEYKKEEEIDYGISLDDLVKAMEEYFDRVALEKPVNTKITRRELSVDDSIKSIKNKFKVNKKIKFYELFEVKTKEYIVVTFLAILEMAKKGDLKIIQDNNFNEIICEAL